MRWTSILAFWQVWMQPTPWLCGNLKKQIANCERRSQGGLIDCLARTSSGLVSAGPHERSQQQFMLLRNDRGKAPSMAKRPKASAPQEDDIIDRLADLHKQATVERSHYYVGKCVRDAIAEIQMLRTMLQLMSSK